MILDHLAVERVGVEHEWMRVELHNWGVAAAELQSTGFTYFSFLSGIDWLPNPELDGEHAYDTERDAAEPVGIITDPVQRLAGGSSRFQVIAHVENVELRFGVTITADLDDTLHVPTWTRSYAGADWHERETWEMFGFVFDGHPGLRHLYLPAEFQGHPLRKDFPLLARTVRPWPGLVDMEEMPTAEEPEQDFA